MSELEPASVLTRVRANAEEFPFLCVPYSLRQFHAPGVDKSFWIKSGYTNERHENNQLLLKNVLDVHGGETERTPWLTSGIGVVAVRHDSKKFDFTSVSLADDSMVHRQGLHFVRQDVTVHPEKGIKARTRVYPTISRIVANYTSSDAAWALTYPTLRSNPDGASGHMEHWLMAPHELERATPKSIEEAFPLRPFALRHWVGVRVGRTS